MPNNFGIKWQGGKSTVRGKQSSLTVGICRYEDANSREDGFHFSTTRGQEVFISVEDFNAMVEKLKREWETHIS